MVRWMVERGANINHLNSKGETPLAVATGHKQTGIADYLKSRGAKQAAGAGSP
jgi:hypothetical protein